ncbi:hypothetical protein PENTCL1PPCAC_23764, partial [Pristionchus entomophagus]
MNHLWIYKIWKRKSEYQLFFGMDTIITRGRKQQLGNVDFAHHAQIWTGMARVVIVVRLSHHEQLEDRFQLGLLHTRQQLLRLPIAIDNLRSYRCRHDREFGSLCGLLPRFSGTTRLEDTVGTEGGRLLLRLLLLLLVFLLFFIVISFLISSLPLPHSFLLLLRFLHQNELVRRRDLDSHDCLHFLIEGRKRGIRMTDHRPGSGCSDTRLRQSLLHLHQQRDVLLHESQSRESDLVECTDTAHS